MKSEDRGCSAVEVSLSDQAERDLIASALDCNMLVEAAAGTGKTASMVRRMVALLKTGRCPHIRHLVAITFTRKAAAEIRSRFQVALEREVREARGRERESLERALAEVEQCFMGTIHSFCARLLRERPVEAGVGLSFREMDEREDARLREEAWELFAAHLTAHDPDGLREALRRVGMRLSDLRDSFLRHFAEFPDVEEWPLALPEDGESILQDARRKLENYIAHMKVMRERLPQDHGNDELIPRYLRLPRVVSHHRLDDPRELTSVLEHFDRKVRVVQKVWKTGRGLTEEDAKREQTRWDEFRKEVAVPALNYWRAKRYAAAMPVLQAAREVYDSLRLERERLNFQDLLIGAARLLRDHPDVRRGLQRRYSHILVDEFQDTDPVQAEVVFLLASSDVHEKDWRRCVPRPGSLFLVGDPKQSIYRFRRADISTYNEVKSLLSEHGGLVVNLHANFRSVPTLLQWVNDVFSPREGPGLPEEDPIRFPAVETETSPAYVGLVPARISQGSEFFQGVFRLTVPGDLERKEDSLAYEAERIARFINAACQGAIKLPRTPEELTAGYDVNPRPSDFLILTYETGDLEIYAEKLREYGVPHQVTGGEALNCVPELEMLYLCLRAVLKPEDQVALVALLRSELFGFSDSELYTYKKQGGVFSFRAPVPDVLPGDLADRFRITYQKLVNYRRWLLSMPHAAALERIASDLGLFASASLRPGGSIQAGGLAKALELLRQARADILTTSQLLEFLERLVKSEEKHDGVPALSEEPPSVRVMNLHKAKGLEAAVVFLADPYGDFRHPAIRHIDRSSDRIRGYMAVYRDHEAGGGKLLACPWNWESLACREEEFLKAEKLRLRYVASTRAAAACIVTRKEKRDHRNPWRHFGKYLERAAELPELEVGPRQERRRRMIDLPGIEDAQRDLSERLTNCLEPTYQVIGAKSMALSSWRISEDRAETSGETWGIEELVNLPESGFTEQGFAWESPLATETSRGKVVEEGAEGLEWGEVMHSLLRVAAMGSVGELESFAAELLQERGMDPGLARRAVKLAERMLSSNLWKRAQESSRCLSEVPFHFFDARALPVPTLIRGVIDLAFREAEGWVLVDYKTDRDPQGDYRRLALKYAPQLQIYKRAWEEITGEPVKESLIYMVEADRLFRIACERPGYSLD